MRRQNRRPLNTDKETQKLVWISASVLIIAILAFTITFVVYRNYLNRNSDFKATTITDLGSVNNMNNNSSSEASSAIGKTVNEVQEETNTTNTEKIAINISNIEKQNTTNEVGTKSNNTVTNTEAQNTKTNKEPEPVPDPTFIIPVEGEILKEFAKDKLVYSLTLKEWVTHNGIDIAAEKTTVVKASAEGTVKSIKNDPRYGITVVIEHVNGFTSVYSNLLTAEFVTEGESVKQGQTVGTVGNTATFEIADDPHLHFEILKDNEYVDPSLYIK